MYTLGQTKIIRYFKNIFLCGLATILDPDIHVILWSYSSPEFM